MIARNLLGLSAAALLLSISTVAYALPTHTWVSTKGSDSNSGTMASPYADFATAAANTAAGGTVSVLDAGDYGPLTITQSITIDGTGGGSIGFAGDGEGIYIDPSSAASVVIRNLTIDGGGTGSDAIFVASAGTTNVVNVVIDNCHIEGFVDIGIGLGSESPMNVVVRNTSIVGGELGVRTFQNGTVSPVSYDFVVLQNVAIQGASSAGVFTRNGTLEITNSVLQNNLVALEADTSAILRAESSMIAQNGTAACAFTTGKVSLSNNNIYDNGTGVAACGGTIKTGNNNRDSGNTNGNPVSSSSVSPIVIF